MNRLKQGFSVGLGVIGGLRSKLGKNTTFKALIAVMAISLCGFVEAKTPEPRYAPTEHLNSSQVLPTKGADDLEAGNIALGKVQNSIGKGSSKYVGSVAKPFQTEQVNTTAKANYGGDNSKRPFVDFGDNVNEIVQSFILGLILCIYQ